MAMAVYNDTHKETARYSFLIKPDGYKVGATEIHGITHEMAVSTGVPFEDVFTIFSRIVSECKLAIGHNVSFDVNVLLSECIRKKLDISIFADTKFVCTMKMAKSIFLSPVNKLSFLYKKFFDEDLDGAHNAMVDTLASARLYSYLISENRKRSSIKAKRVVIKASDVAACIGMNQYKKSHEVMCDMWKRYAPDTFTGETKLDIQERTIASSPMAQQILAYATETTPANSDEACDIVSTASACIKNESSLSSAEKVHVSDYIRSKVSTGHGIRNENKTADLDAIDLIEDSTFYTHKIITIADTEYVIVGRIDRYYIDSDGSSVLVEIKNRMNRLFGRVRDYENIQVQAYMAMTGMKRGRLIEQYNNEIKSYDIKIDASWDEAVGVLREFCRTLHHNMSGCV
jgi:DNA polymerase III epsilon subunit-like protein